MFIRQQKAMAVWLLILILAGAASVVGLGGWLLMQNADQRNEPETTAPTVTQQNKRPQAPTPPVQQPKTAQNSAAVDLTLKGVITRSDETRSSALISIGEQAEQSYLSGDEILPGITLQAVTADHVELLIRGQREILYINRTLQGIGEPTTETHKTLSSPESAVADAETDEADEDDWDDEDWEDEEDDWDDEDWEDEEDDWDDEEE